MMVFGVYPRLPAGEYPGRVRSGQGDLPPPRLVLVGMRVPPNYGRAYTERFQAVYPELARENGAELVPFLLDRVGGVARLNQADGIHPTAEGQRVMAETVWKVLGPS